MSCLQDDDWKSYTLTTPPSSTGNYSLVVYEDDDCETDDDFAVLSAQSGNFPGNLMDEVEAFRICPPGVQPPAED